MGLVMKSKAPALSAWMAVSMLPWAVITATGVRGDVFWMCATSAMPSPSGRRRSVKHRSNVYRFRSSWAWARLMARREPI